MCSFKGGSALNLGDVDPFRRGQQSHPFGIDPHGCMRRAGGWHHLVIGLQRDVAIDLVWLGQAERADAAVRLAAEQKAARDARYAARKAAKKERRRGY